MQPTTETRRAIEQQVSAAIAGDASALRALWEDHRRYVATVLIAHKPASADIEDLLQDVAATLVAKVHTLDEPGAFLPWLRTVALNVARLAARRHNAAPVLAAIGSGGADGSGSEGSVRTAVGGSSEDHDPGVDRSRHEEATGLLALAQQLPDDYREPLLLRCMQDMSYRQIAETLGLPETTIETRIARGRRMLRELALDRMKPASPPNRVSGPTTGDSCAPSNVTATGTPPRRI